MVIVDAQVHPWLLGESTGHHRRTPIDNATMLQEMQQAGVDKVVLVPPLWDHGGNTYALEMARNAPDKFSVMGLLDPEAHDASSQLTRWHDEPCMRGIRFLLNTPERLKPLHNGLYDPLWPIAQEQGIPVAILAPGHLSVVYTLAQRYPSLTLIIDHLAVPRGAVGPRALEHWPELLGLARFSNVHVKAVGVGDYALDPYPFTSLEKPLQQVFEAFGEDRVIWGSDLSRLHHPYAQCVAHFQEHLPFLSSAACEKVMGGNILRLLGWN